MGLDLFGYVLSEYSKLYHNYLTGRRKKKKINEQRKKPLEKELITRHMQLGTIAANYLVFLQVSKLLLNSIQFLKQRLLAQVKLGYELPHAPEKQSKL